MMSYTRYLPENFEQCRLEETILRHFLFDFDVYSSFNALIQDGGKNHEKAYWYWVLHRRLVTVFQVMFSLEKICSMCRQFKV